MACWRVRKESVNEKTDLPALKELTFGDNACRGDEENYAVSLSKLVEYLNVLVMRSGGQGVE